MNLLEDCICRDWERDDVMSDGGGEDHPDVRDFLLVFLGGDCKELGTSDGRKVEAYYVSFSYSFSLLWQPQRGHE